jgi:hypothetical protein
MAKRNVITAVSKQPAPEASTRKTIINPPPAVSAPEPEADVAIASPETAQEIEQEDNSRVTVMIPRAFILTLDNHHQVQYPAGIDEMPIEHANHWYAKACGVEIYDKKRA